MVAPFVVLALTASSAPLQSLDGWKRYDLPEAKISLELPAEPNESRVQLKEAARKYIEQYLNYTVSAPGVFILVSHTLYVEGVAVDLRKAAEGAVSNIKSQEGVSGAAFTFRDIRRDDKPAVAFSGTYTSGKRRLAYEALVIGAGRQLWLVGVGFESVSTEGRVAARNCLGSIKVGGSID